MPDHETSVPAPTRPAGPQRHPARYDDASGPDARRAIVLVLAAQSLIRSSIGRKGRTVSALHKASLPIAKALDWPDAVFARQHVARSKRIEQLYHRIRFGPAHARHKAPSNSENGEDKYKAQAREEKLLRGKTQAENDELKVRIKAIRHSDAIAQVRLFAHQFGLTLGAATPQEPSPQPST